MLLPTRRLSHSPPSYCGHSLIRSTGIWDGNLQHRPVLTIIQLKTAEPKHLEVLTMSKTTDPLFVENTRVEYALTLSPLIMRLKEVKSEKELNEIYNSIVFALQRPWKKKVRKRSTHGGFWTTELNEMSKQRKNCTSKRVNLKVKVTSRSTKNSRTL